MVTNGIPEKFPMKAGTIPSPEALSRPTSLAEAIRVGLEQTYPFPDKELRAKGFFSLAGVIPTPLA